MKKPTLMVGAGALALLVVAVGLSLRPGSDPVAAQQPAAPCDAFIGKAQIDIDARHFPLARGNECCDEAEQGTDGEIVTTFKTYHGTHRGTFLGVAPTGRRMRSIPHPRWR